MDQLYSPFVHLKQCLSHKEVNELCDIYREYIPRTGIPCYAFLKNQDHPLLRSIASLVSSVIGLRACYLNDFFFYTDARFSTPWHVDTELYVFKSAVNAWILLEPDEINNPLGFIEQVNNPGTTFYHSVERESANYVFVDYAGGETLEVSAEDVESSYVPTPNVRVGDILLLDPQRFHRTNTSRPKGACVFKFVYSSDDSLARDVQMPAIMWPEVSLYNNLLSKAKDWGNMLGLISEEIDLYSRDSRLVTGFYPDHFDHLVDKARSLQR